MGKGTDVLQNFQKFRVRVWKCHGTHRCSGYCGTGVQNSQEVPDRYKKCCTRTPGIVARGVQNSHKFRVRVLMPGYGYESLTELPDVPGIVARAYKSYRSSGQV